MSRAKKITQIFSLIFLATFFVSCKDRCYDADEFDSEYVTVSSKPIEDGITGTYDSVYGGQHAEWHETNLKSNGKSFIIKISGAWVPWYYKNTANDQSLSALQKCDFWAKNDSITTCNRRVGNDGDDKEYSYTGTSPNYTFTSVSDGCLGYFGTYLYPAGYYDDQLNTLIADNQNVCKYYGGIGVYIGLFGSSGVTMPKRLYHLYPGSCDLTETGSSAKCVCDVTLNSGGECIDEYGVDRTSYVFRSANNRIFLRDDKDGNVAVDANTGNDEYHTAGEVIRLKIFDVYYNDNYGGYNIEFLQGVGISGDGDDKGLLEFMVRLVENTMLGTLDSSGVRQGGVIEFMYKSIVQDSGFILFLQVLLSLYIAFYGMAVLLGIAEVSRKELINRLLKISLVILFTTASSWSLYRDVVVGFFYDGMNYCISLLTSLSDKTFNNQSTTLKILIDEYTSADVSNTNSTRFSYIDTLITMLFSEAASAKIFGLILNSLFGILYIPIIYLLIGFFLYVMLTAALTYAINIMKLVFVLCLGPIFMCFMLFGQTNQMFKNWLGFLGGRSLEMVMLFFVLYNFVTLLDTNFRDLLSYRSCVEPFNVGLFSIKILKAHIDRSLIEWMLQFAKIGGLIFITKMIVDQIPSLAGRLISIGGVANRAGAAGNASGAGQSSSNMANTMMESALGLANKGRQFASEKGGDGGALFVKAGTFIARKTGVADMFAKVTDVIPISSPRAMARNTAIDKQINIAKQQAAQKGLSGKDADKFIRQNTISALQKQMNGYGDKESMGSRTLAMAGMDLKTISARIDKKLIQDPLKQFIKDEAKRIKNGDPNKIPDPKTMRQQIRDAAKDWAKNNLYAGVGDVEKYIDKTSKKGLKGGSNSFERSLKNLLKDQARLKTSEAAKAYANDPQKQKQFLQQQYEQHARRQAKNEEARKWNLTWAGNILSRGADMINPFTHHDRNLDSAQQAFLRQTKNNERGWFNKNFLNPLNRSNTLDKMNPFGDLRNRSRDAALEVMRNKLAKDALEGKRDKSSEFMMNDLYKKSKKVNWRDATVFEKAANLSHLYKKDVFKPVSDLIRKTIEEEKDKIIEKLKDGKSANDLKGEVDNLRSLQSALFSSSLPDSLQAKIDDLDLTEMKKGEFSAKDILKNLEESNNRIQELEKILEVKATLDKAEKEVEENNKKIAAAEKIVADLEKATAEEQAALISQAKEALGIIPQKFEFEFGSSASDLLLKAPDIGLKESNLLLGIDPQQKPEVDPLAKQSLGIDKNIVSGKLKMAKMDLKIAEFELQQLDTVKDKDKISELKTKIYDLEKEVNNCSSEVDRVDKDLKSLEN